MNYGSPIVWEMIQTENSTFSEELLNAIGTDGSVGSTGLGPISPDVAYMGYIAYGVVAPVIITFGIFTNLLNLIVLTRPTLRGPTYRYLMWLAVANLLVCIALLPFTLHSHHTPVGYFPALYLAHMEMPFGNALIASSVYIVVGLSIDRFVAVCHPRKYRNLHSHRVASVRIAVSFLIGFFIYIPMSLGKKVVRVEGFEDQFLPQENLKVTSSKWWFIYKCVLEICARFAPAVLLAFLNIWIIIEFKKVSRRRRHMSQNMAELSGFPSQSMADISQGTTQQPQKEEMALILSQLNETKQSARNPPLLERKRTLQFSPVTETKTGSDEIIIRETSMTVTNGIQNESNGEPIHNGTVLKLAPCLPKKVQVSESTVKYKCEDTAEAKTESDTTNNNTEVHFQDVPVDEPSETVPVQTSIETLENAPVIVEDDPKSSLNVPAIQIKESPTAAPSGRHHKPMSARRLDMERRLVLLLVSIIIAFFLTNIPTAILSLTFTQDKRSNLSYQIFRAVANNLEFLNFGLNFILYFLFSQDIRNAFMAVLHRSIRHISKRLFNSSTVTKIPSVI